MNRQNLATLSAACLLLGVIALPALGADADWVAPVNEGVKSLTASLVAIAGGVIGLCIVGYAIWGAVKQRLDGAALMTLFACGLLVGIGPAAIVWWIGLVNKTGS